MIAHININKNVLFFRWRKLNISIVFMKQPYISVPKEVRLKSILYPMMKIYNRGQYNKLL